MVVLDKKLEKLGLKFPTTITSNKHNWPFKNDLSDVEKAYIEFEGKQEAEGCCAPNEVGDEIGVYVLLKKDTLLKLIYNYSKTTLIIDSIVKSKISSIRETSTNNDAFHGFNNQKVEITMNNGKAYTFNEPTIIDGRDTGSFACENTGRYNKVINLLMK
jgi:hypothetical protein